MAKLSKDSVKHIIIVTHDHSSATDLIFRKYTGSQVEFTRSTLMTSSHQQGILPKGLEANSADLIPAQI